MTNQVYLILSFKPLFHYLALHVVAMKHISPPLTQKAVLYTCNCIHLPSLVTQASRKSQSLFLLIQAVPHHTLN